MLLRRNKRGSDRKNRLLYPLITLLAPLLPSDNYVRPQPTIELRAEGEFFSLYSEEERKMFLDKLNDIIARISRRYDITQVFISIPNTPCIGDIHTDAMTGFLLNGEGEKGLLLCFAFLTSPDQDKSPREYWMDEWGRIFGHEYRHVLDYQELGADPFIDDPYPYLDALRVVAKAENISVGFVETQNVQIARIVMQAMQELRVLMKALKSEPHDDIQKRFISLSSHIDDLKRDGRFVDILLGDIITGYILNNEEFRRVMGIEKREDLTEAHAKFRDAVVELKQHAMIRGLYEEMNAYAKLAEKEGYRMIGTWQ
ncbi:MAG TPA: hypothetical protein VI912_04920 [Candidatus Bilamarchaeaceae archaeon]|nr:hypothetical protein [Candidatus Bilamarchaeaceae archaeon]